VRDLILEQERGRLNGKKMTLWLEGVMEQAVTVDTDKNSPLDRSGTAVFLKGLSTDMGDRLKNQEKLEQYLQDTIPVPFNPDFKWGRFIQSELDKRKYHSIKVELSHGGKKYNIYRPYVNDIFSNKSGEEPAFIEVKNPDSHDVFGFCWYCVNDSNNVIPKNYERIRSLVVKKFGFSVGQRTYTQKFFNRKVISDRITGEIIITNQKLLPNAARDDFEAGPIRDSYHLAIYSLVSTVTEHVDRLQTERKALDVLDEAKLVITKLFESIPMSSGDVEKLLDLKSRLEIYEDRKLKPQRAWLKKNRANDIRQLDELIKNVKSKITELIQTKKEKRTGKVIEVLEKISKKAPRGTTRKQTPSPKCLLDVVDQLGLTVSQTMQDFLNAVDAKIIKPNFQEDEYILALADLFEEMEDVL